MTEESPSLTVVVPTYRRPEVLAGCLDAVLTQLAEAAADGVISTTDVLVIDNDPEASAREQARSRGAQVRFVHETTPGIAAVRARAVCEVGTRLLVFIDDDEVPQPGWLTSLVATWRDTGAVAVMGRVVSVFDGPVHPWITAGDLFGRPRRPTGTPITTAAAGNLLLDAAWVREHGITFDARLGLGGGEDTLFSRHLVAAGGTLVWCDESVADDHVPAERVTRRWLARRFFSHGHTEVVVDLLSTPAGGHARVRVRAAFGGTARLGAGAAWFVAGALRRSQRSQARAMRLVARGAGMLWGAAGVAHEEYRRPVGGVRDVG